MKLGRLRIASVAMIFSKKLFLKQYKVLINRRSGLMNQRLQSSTHSWTQQKSKGWILGSSNMTGYPKGNLRYEDFQKQSFKQKFICIGEGTTNRLL
eukprot:snap_masked-scaffold_44-processed-gene-1.56-mRNA-1 protein AED:1.00 eAED:1.00 QI:0/0/0/0/1/1/2/0/95